MDRRHQDSQNSTSNSIISATPKSSLKKAFSLSEAVTARMMPEFPFHEIQNDQQVRQTKKSSLKDMTQPLAFSNTTNFKKRLSYFGESSFISRPSRHSKMSTVIIQRAQDPIHQCEQLKESELKNQKLKKQFKELKTQSQLVLNHLSQTKKQIENANASYESKCQEAQALKQIINSIQNYVFKEEQPTPVPTPPKVQANSNQKTGLLSAIPHKRRVSIQNGPLIVKKPENSITKHVLLKLQQYAKNKLTQSINDIISQSLI